MNEEYRHQRAAHQFETWIDGELVGRAAYTLTGTVAAFDHTVVKPSMEGRGVAGRLVRHAMDEIRAEGVWKVRPVCTYVVAWVKRHPEYADLIA